MNKQHPSSLPQVLLWLPTSLKASRDVMRGVLKYNRLHGHWAVTLLSEQNALHTRFDPSAWGCTGMIVDMRDRQLAARLVTAQTPAVLTCVPDDCLLPDSPYAQLSRIECDDASIGNLAAAFFLERQFKHFAFVGDVAGTSWSARRRNAFQHALQKAGFPCHTYPPFPLDEQTDFSEEQKNLCAWLQSLPKPAALFAATDIRGRQILNSCLKANIDVPREIAVLGVDNDELNCETAQPTLSSIQMQAEQAGFQAAQVLDRMMACPQTETRQTVIRFGAKRLIQRDSTAPEPFQDPLVTRAMTFILLNANATLKVDDVAQHLNLSRRWLEKRFQATRGQTVHAIILRTRLERARTLLETSLMTVEEIAATCGFSSASHLGTLFRRIFNIPPAAYRRMNAHQSEQPSFGQCGQHRIPESH